MWSTQHGAQWVAVMSRHRHPHIPSGGNADHSHVVHKFHDDFSDVADALVAGAALHLTSGRVQRAAVDNTGVGGEAVRLQWVSMHVQELPC